MDEHIGFDAPIDAVTGLLDADVTIPHDVSPGPHGFGWMCALSDMVFGAEDEKVPFTVLDPGTNSPEPTPPGVLPNEWPEQYVTPEAAAANATDELADTGSSTAITTAAAIGFALAGGIALAVHHRRNRRLGREGS